jgi:hypothetical protein
LESATINDVGARPLEDIFGNAVARVLDFLIINEPFDYSLGEISQIVLIPLDSLRKMIPVLVEKGLLEEIGKKSETKTFKLNEKSDLARSLRQYVLAKINNDIEREKFTRKIKTNVTAPGIENK